MRQDNRYNPQDDLQNANQQNQYYEDDYDNEEYYDEEDQYYSPEQIERERRYLEQEEKRRAFSNKIKNPFGIIDKLDNIDEQLKYGSSKTKLIFVMASLLGILVLGLLFFFVLK